MSEREIVLRTARECLIIIAFEPEYPQSIFRELPFWRALRLRVWQILHPHRSGVLVTKANKSKISDRIRAQFGLKP